MYGSINLPAITTGTSLMKMSGGLGNGTTQMSPMESMKEVFLEIRDNTKETVELLKTMVMGSAAENRDTSLSGGDTDVGDTKPSEKGPGLLSRVGGSIKGAASSILGSTLGKLALAAGGFALLKIFGDDAIGPLAELIKSIKQGKIGENISSAYKYIKEVGVDAFEKLKVNTVLFIDGVKKVMGIIQGAYNSVNDYVMSFDTKGTVVEGGPLKGLVTGDKKLDSEEFDALKDDLQKRAVAVIGDFFKDLMLSFGGAILAGTFIGFTVKKLLAHPAISNIFSFGRAASLPALGVGAPVMSAAAATLGIGALLLYGITTTYKNVSKSLAKTLKENNDKFVASSFFANFFGGDDEGGAMNALKQAFLVGGTGTLAGLGIAGTMAAAGAIAGPGGVIAGGLIGLAIGGIIGIMSGLTGSEKLEKMFKKFGAKVNDTIDAINGFFDGLLDSFKSFVTGSTTKYETDEGAMTSDLEKLKQDKKDAEEVAAGKYATAYQKKQPAEIQKDIDKLMGKIENVDEAKAKYEEEQAFSSVKGLTDSINYQKRMLNNRRVARDLAKAIERGDTDTEARIREKQKNLSDRILSRELEKQAKLKKAGVDYQIPMLTQMDYSKDFNTIVDSRYQNTGEMLNPGGPSHPSNATIVTDVNNDKSIKTSSETFLTGNLQAGRPEQANKIIAARGVV